jgi:hypothetical protein
MVVNLLPPVVSLLSLVSFYILTRELKLELPIKVAALFAYALIPSAFMDQTEAAGLAESFGSLAMIWLVITLIRADRSRSTVAYSLVGLSWGICIVASPGSAYASFLTTMLFFALQLTVHSQQKDRLPLIQCMSISAVIAILLTSPYWLTVISNHGLGVFTTSFGAQHDGAFLGIISAILEAIFEHGFPGAGFGYISYLWGGVICIGLINLLSRRQLTLPLWFIVCFSVPREGGWLASIPMAILAGFGIVTVFKTLPVITQLLKPERPLKRSLYLCLITLFFGGLFLDTQTRFQERVTGQYKAEVYFDRYYDITYADIEAMEWVRNNTPSEAKFVALTRDQVLEWLPFIAQRTVINTPYGSEWEPKTRKAIFRLNTQLKLCYNTACFYNNALNFNNHKDIYLYIDQFHIDKFGDRPYYKNSNMTILWENNEAVIGLLSTP